ncbi:MULTISPECIES: ABC transporter ATP-binding protein [Roseobacteraceae]|uniref:Glutathione import ATP-binding protein GsiA n=1 Tax=Pseudosulfitobacter pseudonitzschiae TaxID=1402135 RepID=A0A221K5S1_9RHOB|nr:MULTISPECIES: ABC transporter ATP-binding protein [Roseobacteraceae]ASM74351.1 glutathione import ATP-binding protein GsiA [Pseudosulfitobacter pseudonitzschiae]
MIPTPPVVEISSLTVALPDGLDRRYAVEDVSLEIASREILCIVGESGSGKSVTASVVMGLLPPNVLRIESGSVMLEGEDITHASNQRLDWLRGNRMAMIFQEPLTALNPVMPLGRQIAEVLLLHKRDLSGAQIKSRVLELMKDVHLPTPEQIYGRYPHQISGGQRQRVMIAMALAMEPALIIADEPTTALDVTTQAQILKLFRELLHKHNSAIMLITHDFGVVAEVADRVVVMRHGRIVEAGSTQDVLYNPRDPYTRDLIAAVPRLRFSAPVRDAEPVLKVENLSVTYRQKGFLRPTREVRAVQDASLVLRSGQTIGIVGESGSGKSTLARAIVGFEAPSSGRLIFAGRESAELKGRAKAVLRNRVQMVFQDPYSSLNPRRTVGQSMVEGPVRQGMPIADARQDAVAMLERVGLSKTAMDRFPHEFSGGQRQRICIARALVMRPEIIVADEAVSALDVTVQAQVLALFDELRTEMGFSMIFITHDLRVASNICNEIIVMREGRIVEHGLVRDVFESPANAYTQNLIAAMPRLKGTT